MTQAQIDARDLEKLLKGMPNVKITLSMGELLVLISHVQLALRHPHMHQFGAAAPLAESLVRRFIKHLPIAAQPYMLAGFDPAQDVPIGS